MISKNVVILHGSGETDKSFWLPYAKKELEKKGYKVSIPLLPNTDNPDIKAWLPVALKEDYSQETIIIGHSAGCPLQLSVLENINVRVKQVILVSGYARKKGGASNFEEEPILQKDYNWKMIKENVEDIILINSDNDPWGCDDVEGRYILDKLGKGKLIVMKGEGHMGSDRFKQPYKEFPFLLKLID